jgi:SsrA-binding protein
VSKGGKRKSGSSGEGDIANNRKALRDYTIVDKFEAGIVLVGTEVKSIRDGALNLRDAYALVSNDEVFLHGCDIQPYASASHTQHEAKAVRKLLLNKREIAKLRAASEIKGQAIIALRAYWKNRRVKVELGIGKGKSHVDQREDLKKKAQQREMDRELAKFNKHR